MRKKLLNTKLWLITMMLALFSSGNLWATDVTFTFGKTNRDVNSTSSVEKSGVTVSVSQNGATNAPNFTSDASDVRFQAGNKMSISSANNITKIVITYTSSSYAEKITQKSFSAGTYSYTSGKTTGTWTGSVTSLDIVNTASAQSRISQIVVTYTPTYTLTYSATNGSIGGVVYNTSTAVASGASVAEGGKVTLTATPADGYEFDSWEVSGTGSSLSSTSTNPTTFTMGTANSTVTANFVATSGTPTYTLTITPPTGGTITVKDSEDNAVSSGDKFEENAELTLSAAASTGYTFTTWTKTAGTFGETATTADNTFTMPGSAATIGATFTKNSYSLSLTNTNGSLAVTVDGEDWDGSSKIPYNAEVEITATADDGYLFREWTSTDIVDYDEVTNPLTFNMPAGNVEIEASFVDAYSITVDNDVTGGTISADKASAAEDATITLTATPSTGYTFTSWTVKDAKDNTITVTNNKFTMPASNVTVTATFTAIAVTGVTLNKTSTTLGVGDTETLTATIAPSNALNKAITWSSNNTSVATVSNGVVTAVAAGSATITVTTTDGSKTATCAVTVENAVTFTAGTDKGSTTSNNSADEMEKSGVTISSTDAALAQTEYRLYSGSTTTITTNSGKITKIEFTKNGSYSLSNLSKTSGSTGSYNSSTGTWTGVASSVAFSASAQVRLDKIKVFVANTATPTFSVATGEYSAAQSVELSCATDGATIYYTTDGTTPTSSSTAYSSAIPITTTTTLKAIAIYDGIESAVASATYTMNRPAAPAFDVEEGVFDAAFDLHLSTETDGATIYYTTDGSTPTTSSSVYSTKVTISTATTTVKAIAVKSGLTSDVASAIYTYDKRTTPTFTLSATSIDLKVNETSSAVTLTTNSDATPSFTCADAHVTLTGTGNSRTISANAAGTYTVNVSVSGSATYKDAAGTITVNVTKKATTMVLTPSFTSKDLYVTTSGSLTGVVQYNSSDVDGATVTYSSSDEKVATINSSTGAVTFKKAGTTTLKASYSGTDEYEECEATYELTLTDTRPQETEVDITINNTFFECSSFTTWTTGMATTLSGESKNITVTYTKGTSANMYCSSEKARFYTGNTFTIEAPDGYHIISVDMGVDISSADPEGEISTDTWTGDASSVSFTFAHKTDISSITVTLAPTISVSSASWATYSSKHALDFTDVSTIYAYTATVSGDKVTFSRVKKVPANTGVLLYADGGVTNEAVPTLTGDADNVTGNLLVGTSTDIASLASSDEDYNYYILNNGSEGIGFYSANGQKVGAGKAYLKVSKKSEIRGFVPFDFDDVTSIQSVVKGNTSENIIYDLQGRRVSNPRNGMYIVNGKKVFVK